MDTPILIVATGICIEKSIFSESRENSLQKRQPHLQDLSPLHDSLRHFSSKALAAPLIRRVKPFVIL